VVKGTVNFKEDELPKILADKITDIEEVRVTEGRPTNTGDTKEKPIQLIITEDMDEGETLGELKGILQAHPGEIPVIIRAMASRKRYKTKPDLWVNGEKKLYEKLEELIGKNNIR
ncbi:MAG: hypothetical protein RR131_03620, partial [Anaerovorax sp.]